MLAFDALAKIPLASRRSSGATSTLAADFGSFVLTGEPVTLELGRLMPADFGSFVLTGEPVALTVGRQLAAGFGAFVLTGEPVSLTTGTIHGTIGQADFGSFVLTGFSVEGWLKQGGINATPFNGRPGIAASVTDNPLVNSLQSGGIVGKTNITSGSGITASVSGGQSIKVH